ncbi:MAG: peptide chain release factor 1, partial [Planctomycetales bacterium 12-60-4]
MLFPTLQAKLSRYEEVERLLQDPDVLADTSKMVELQREHGGLGKVALAIREFNQLEADMQTAQEMVAGAGDDSEREYAQSEFDSLKQRHDVLKSDLEDMVTAGDSLTRGSLIMEIRAGTGGEEAALFANDLFNMYTRYVDKQGWKFEVIDM